MKKNKGLEQFIEQAMNVDDDLVQRGQIHGDFNPEEVAKTLNLNGDTIHLEGTVDEKADQLLDMFKKLDEK
ncbi:hypothetical protein XbC2_497 [Xanthomonas phage XbC2]|nr:hypothetical protein XbC2_497 [Xanthomonas phage XbC2]